MIEIIDSKEFAECRGCGHRTEFPKTITSDEQEYFCTMECYVSVKQPHLNVIFEEDLFKLPSDDKNNFSGYDVRVVDSKLEEFASEDDCLTIEIKGPDALEVWNLIDKQNREEPTND